MLALLLVTLGENLTTLPSLYHYHMWKFSTSNISLSFQSSEEHQGLFRIDRKLHMHSTTNLFSPLGEKEHQIFLLPILKGWHCQYNDAVVLLSSDRVLPHHKSSYGNKVISTWIFYFLLVRITLITGNYNMGITLNKSFAIQWVVKSQYLSRHLGISNTKEF